MPSSRNTKKKSIGVYEWETNIDKLKEIASDEGITFSDLIKKLTRHHLEKHNKTYKTDEK
jgi:hypothetical protein